MISQADDKSDDDLHVEAAVDIALWAHATQGSIDPVARVLRLHALTEFYLNRALALHLKHADSITEDARFSYYHKRVIAKSVNALPERVLESLKRLTALRNKCAHSPTPKITTEEILHAAQPIKESYDNAIADHAKDGVKLTELSAYSWALFAEMTLEITPYEIFLSSRSDP